MGRAKKDEAEGEVSGPHRAGFVIEQGVIEQGVYFPVEQPFSLMR